MRVRVLVCCAAALALTAAGCSSSSGTPAATGTSPSPAASASDTPGGPNPALCNAARTLVAGAQPTFNADANAPVQKQSADDSAFYTQLLLVFSENNGADPISQPVAADAQKLAQDYNTLEVAAQQSDLDGQTKALQALTADLGAMLKDQAPFDQACGIPAIAKS